MKKVLVMVLALMMLFGLAACGNEAKDKTTEAAGIDMSKYPADINEWTSQNFLDYFAEAGVFTKSEWTYIQDHANYYVGTAVNECAGYMDDTGMIMISIFTFDPESTEVDVKAALESIRTNKTLPAELGSIPVDHMAGNVVFWYSMTTDEAAYNAMDAAYNELVKALGVTPDF